MIDPRCWFYLSGTKCWGEVKDKFNEAGTLKFYVCEGHSICGVTDKGFVCSYKKEG